MNFLDPTSDGFFLKKAFVPDEDPVQVGLENVKNVVSDKLGFNSWTDLLAGLSNVTADSQSYTDTISVYGVGEVTAEFVDLSSYEQSRNMVYTIIRGVLAILLVIYNINQIYKLLNRGGTLADGVGAMQGSKSDTGGNK